MTDNGHYLHDRPREIAQFARVGFSEHHQTEQLLSAGKLPVNRFVIEAGNYERPSGLIRTLHDENAEIILDTNVAELSTKGQYAGEARFRPSPRNRGPLGVEGRKHD